MAQQQDWEDPLRMQLKESEEELLALGFSAALSAPRMHVRDAWCRRSSEEEGTLSREKEKFHLGDAGIKEGEGQTGRGTAAFDHDLHACMRQFSTA
jgi:hypothetical protein